MPAATAPSPGGGRCSSDPQMATALSSAILRRLAKPVVPRTRRGMPCRAADPEPFQCRRLRTVFACCGPGSAMHRLCAASRPGQVQSSLMTAVVRCRAPNHFRSDTQDDGPKNADQVGAVRTGRHAPPSGRSAFDGKAPSPWGAMVQSWPRRVKPSTVFHRFHDTAKGSGATRWRRARAGRESGGGDRRDSCRRGGADRAARL